MINARAPGAVGRWGLAVLREHIDMIGAAMTGFALLLPALASAQVLVGSGTDLVTMEGPQLAFFARWAKQGILPLWNPFLYDGVPFPAGVEGYFYPPSWLAVLLSTDLTVKLTFAIHLALAGAGAAWLCRSRVRRRLASYVGGAIFAMSGFLTAHVFAGHLHLVCASAYLPWMVAVVDRVRRRESVVWAAAVAGFGLALLAAQYQMVAIGVLAAGLFAAMETLFASERAVSWPSRLASVSRSAGALAALLLGGALIGAIQLLPLALTLPFTQRQSVDASFASSFPCVPGNLLALLFPRLFGNSADTPFVGDFSFWEAFPYVGLVTLALAAFAVGNLPRVRWLGAAGTAAIGGMLALGDRTPLLRIACALVPLLHRFRAAGRYLVVVALFSALLAALGLDAFLDPQHTVSRRRLTGPLVLTGVAAASFAALAMSTPASFAHVLGAIAPLTHPADPASWEQVFAAARTDALVALVLLGAVSVAMRWGTPRERRAHAGALLALLTVVDLFHAAQPFFATAPVEPSAWLAALADGCRKHAGPGGRILVTPELVAPDAGAPHDLASMAGYAILFDGRYARFVNRAQGAPLDRFISPVLPDGSASVLRHMGTRLIITSLPVVGTDGSAHFGLGNYHLVGGMGPRLKVVEADAPVPRTALLHAVEEVDGEDAIYERMEQPSFDVSRVALVEHRPASWRLAQPPQGAHEQALISAYEPNVVTVDVEAAADALLVLSDAYEPGWTARVDGAPAPIARANWVMRAVPVGPGRHRVVMSYRPPGLGAGAWTTAGALVALVAAAHLERRRRRG